MKHPFQAQRSVSYAAISTAWKQLSIKRFLFLSWPCCCDPGEANQPQYHQPHNINVTTFKSAFISTNENYYIRINISSCHSFTWIDLSERFLLFTGTILMVGSRGYNNGIILLKIKATKCLMLESRPLLFIKHWSKWFKKNNNYSGIICFHWFKQLPI